MADIKARLEAQAAALPDSGDPASKAPVKRSWRRKYRKMRVVFEDKMNQSNNSYREEFKTAALARRLQEQNDQLLDLLVDINDAGRIPGYLRFDLRSPSPSESVIPSLEADADPDPIAIHNLIREARAEMVAGLMSPEEFAKLESKLSCRSLDVGPKSLAILAAQVAHTSELPDPVPEDLQIGDNAPGYLTPNHEEEYLLSTDAALADSTIYDPSAHDGRPLRTTTHPLPTDKELTLRNPDSVYNWLRKHQPQVFLQDKDPHHENASEKSSARPAAEKHGQGRGGGKRPSAVSASTPGPKTEQDILDEEIGFIPETGTGSAKSRRNNKDDEPYRPKGGSSRPAKRKREDGESGKSARKKSRASGGGAGGSGGGS
ncbi:hypothetical protein K432DRAFT_437754 [Lepidopterella palustris CBS 459.81]|uniref:IEC3 subunit of the Ino80 complex, chromatin re-modelling-domain-containing protein n=1 Tax=Lepidopterella palustris CBS 459.81 TaxID=1314670 RepID=A0A8E2JA60_9PEZI|nr:hypothetical protein K432DRAFT_437754 [Lepidopterella palustris CBS 459.81]